MEKGEHNIRRLRDAEEFQEGRVGILLLGIILLLTGGYAIYNRLNNEGGFSVLGLFFAIFGLSMLIFSGLSLGKGKKNIKEIESSIPTQRLNLQRKVDMQAYLLMTFGTLALIFLVLSVVIVGLPQEGGENLSEIIAEKKITLITLLGLFLVFVFLTWFYYRKLKKIKKEGWSNLQTT